MRYGLVILPGVAAIRAVAAASYDYIVVGSGPGGGPLACDLARAGFSTLLIEAGDDLGDNPANSDIRNFYEAANDQNSRWDYWVKHSDDPAREGKYDYTTWRLPDESFYVGLDPPAGAKRLGIQYPRAATLGGCAMHNAGFCSLAQDDDWNIIVNKTGDTSWQADKMKKYLMKIEKNSYLPAGTAGHGFDGWLTTATAPTTWIANENLPGTKIVKELAKLTGQNVSDVANLMNRDILEWNPNRDQISSLYNIVQHRDVYARRSSPNNYIRATLKDPKKYPLTVKLHTLVTKVLFSTNATNPTAIGVQVMEGPSMYRADPRYKPGSKGPINQIMANKEVIVSGGAFNSPQILKLSGIGPAAELKKFNIPLVKDLPGVGEKLGDNYEASVLSIGKVPFGAPSIATIVFKTKSALKNRNIFAWCGSFSFEGFWPGYPNDYGANQYECAMVHIGQKKQAGTVHLASADPQDPPDINFNFFQDGNQDIQELTDGAKLLRQAMLAAGPNVLPFDELHPCPGTGAGNCTDAVQGENIKLQAYSHHATSTCAIGAEDDRMAVLDSKFRVRGVKNLRVVDASIFPVVPGAFPVLPTSMISAKAAEEIIADAKNHP